MLSLTSPRHTPTLRGTAAHDVKRPMQTATDYVAVGKVEA